MSFDPARRDASGSSDPLARLRQRIERAREPQVEAPRRGNGREADDPLDRLERRIAQANSPPPAGPLAELEEWCRRARQMLGEAVGYARPIEADDPIERLERQIAREADAIGGRAAVEPRPAPRAGDGGATTSRPAATDASPTAALGREVVRMLEQTDLPGPARAEAARRLAATIDDPDPEQLHAVLRLLVTGRDGE